MKVKQSKAIEQMLDRIYKHSCDMRDIFWRYLNSSKHGCYQISTPREYEISLLEKWAVEGVTDVRSATHDKFGCVFLFREPELNIIIQLNKILMAID